MCTLDLLKGFLQFSLSSTSQRYTAFSFNSTLYVCLRVPFGFINSPSFFQAEMNRIFLKTAAHPYVDDLIMGAKDFQEMLDQLEVVLDAAIANHIVFSPKKTRLNFEEVEFLGFLLGKGEIRPLVSRLDALVHADVPKTVRQLKGWLGAVGYIRAHIP